jgi:hypothetical protein
VRVKCGNKRLGILTLGFIDNTEDRGDDSMYVLRLLGRFATFAPLVVQCLCLLLRAPQLLRPGCCMTSSTHNFQGTLSRPFVHAHHQQRSVRVTCRVTQLCHVHLVGCS